MAEVVEVIEKFGYATRDEAQRDLDNRIAFDEGSGYVFELDDEWAYRWFPPGFGNIEPANNDAETETPTLNAGRQPPSLPTGGIKGLLDFIAKAESAGNYNAYYRHARNTNDPKITSMTLAQLRDWQDEFVGSRGMPSSAAGRYQIIRNTLDSLINTMGLNRSTTVYDPNTQDLMAVKLLEGRGLNQYLANDLSVDDFANALAREWASLPVVTPQTRNGRPIERGFSYYSGVGDNKALVGVESFRRAVETLRS